MPSLRSRSQDMMWTLLFGLLGLAAGVANVLTSPFDLTKAPLQVWAVLAVALTTVAGLLVPYGSRCWGELQQVARVPMRRAVARMAVPVAVAIGLAVAPAFLPGAAHTSVRGVLLVLTAIVGGLPVAMAMIGVPLAAAALPAGRTAGRHAVDLVALQRLLQRLLPALGWLVTLATLALGASVRHVQSLPADQRPAEALPAEGIVIFGAIGSAIVAAVYVPSRAALREHVYALCQRLVPVETADDPAAVAKLLGDRRNLEDLFAVDRGAFAELQTGLLILGPLTAGAFGLLLPG
jgi:hypothetical protein